MLEKVSLAAVVVFAGAAIVYAAQTRPIESDAAALPPRDARLEARKTQAHRWVQDGALLVDVRTPGEFSGGHIDGAVNIPIEDLEKHTDRLSDKSRPVVVYCTSGVRSARVARALRELGYRVFDLGAMNNW